jgi:hypothetical protein
MVKGCTGDHSRSADLACGVPPSVRFLLPALSRPGTRMPKTETPGRGSTGYRSKAGERIQRLLGIMEPGLSGRSPHATSRTDSAVWVLPSPVQCKSGIDSQKVCVFPSPATRNRRRFCLSQRSRNHHALTLSRNESLPGARGRLAQFPQKFHAVGGGIAQCPGGPALHRQDGRTPVCS